jgi:nucleoside-diphosphate-sugar epimerase
VGITVAVTGPTGEIGISAVSALEQEAGVDRVLGMARKDFDPGSQHWTKTEYRRGDILDRAAVAELVRDADVVLHLAFLIMGSREETGRVNLAGARNVFEAAVAAQRPRRLVYTSSVAAYGYHRENPSPLTEDVPALGSAEHYYSQQKAQCEALLREITDGGTLEVYVLRPCIVAGPRATALADSMPWNRLGQPLSALTRTVGHALPALRPVFPDPGVRLQLIHHDDVASAISATTLGRGSPGAYNLAGDGEITFSDVARAVGGRGVRVPHLVALSASQVLARVPRVPSAAEWIHVGRTSVVMDTSKAKRELGWQPGYTTEETLAAMAAALSRRSDLA